MTSLSPLTSAEQYGKPSEIYHGQRTAQTANYNQFSMDDIKVDADKFDALLRRMVNMKPAPAKPKKSEPKTKTDPNTTPSDPS